MVSELLKYILNNSDKLAFSDSLFFMVVFASLLATSAGIVHWVYKHAFQIQGEVVRSQSKLIEIKDRAIADYEKSLEALKVESNSHKELADSALGRLTNLESVHDDAEKDRHNLLLYASAHVIGVLTAKTIFLRLNVCHSFRHLVRIYATLKAQHGEESGISSELLNERIDHAEAYHLSRADQLDLLGDLSISDAGSKGIPKELLVSRETDWNNDPVPDLERFLIHETLPIFQKYEPQLAKRVEASYQQRLKK